jgi:hypothetical protein
MGRGGGRPISRRDFSVLVREVKSHGRTQDASPPAHANAPPPVSHPRRPRRPLHLTDGHSFVRDPQCPTERRSRPRPRRNNHPRPTRSSASTFRSSGPGSSRLTTFSRVRKTVPTYPWRMSACDGEGSVDVAYRGRCGRRVRDTVQARSAGSRHLASHAVTVYLPLMT